MGHSVSGIIELTIKRLTSKHEYGIPLMSLFQSSLQADPGKVLRLDNVDEHNTDVRLTAKGKEVQLAYGLKVLAEDMSGAELDDTRENGIRLERKGLIFTATTRKLRADERIAKTAERVLGQPIILTHPNGQVVHFKKGRVVLATQTDKPKRYPPNGSIIGRMSFPDLGEQVSRSDPCVEIPMGDDTGGVYMMSLDFKPIEQHVDRFIQHQLEKKGKHAINFMYGFPLGFSGDHVNCRCAEPVKKGKPEWQPPYECRGLGYLDTVACWINKVKCDDVGLPQQLSAGGGLETKIVGSSYRSTYQQKVLQSKGSGNMIVLVREPGNPVDKNAVAAFAWRHGSKDWHLVGYVPSVTAQGLSAKMLEMGRGVILVAKLVDDGAVNNPRIRVDYARDYHQIVRGM